MSSPPFPVSFPRLSSKATEPEAARGLAPISKPRAARRRRLPALAGSNTPTRMTWSKNECNCLEVIGTLRSVLSIYPSVLHPPYYDVINYVNVNNFTILQCKTLEKALITATHGQHGWGGMRRTKGKMNLKTPPKMLSWTQSATGTSENNNAWVARSKWSGTPNIRVYQTQFSEMINHPVQLQ